MKIKFDANKLLPLASMGLGLLGMVVSNITDTNNRNNMKAEIKEELAKELLNNKNQGA